MPLRFGSEADMNVWLNFVANTTQAEQNIDQLGRTVNTMTVEEFKNAQTQGALFNQGLKEIEQQSGQLQRNWWRTMRVMRASSFVFQTVGAAGAAMMAPAILSIKAWQKEVEKSESITDPVARQWLNNMDMLAASNRRVGRSMAQEFLPMLEKATDLLSKGATFVERYPGALAAVFKVGAVITGLAAVGLAVTKGIQLYVDIKFVSASVMNMQAARLMDQAATKNLTAAGGMKGGVLGGAAGLGGAIGGAATLGVASAALGWSQGANIREQLGQKANSLFVVFSNIIPIIGNLVSTGARLEQQWHGLPVVLRTTAAAIEYVSPRFAGLADAIRKLAGDSASAQGAIKGVANTISTMTADQKKGVEIYRNLVVENYEAAQKYIADQRSINMKANAEISSAGARFAASRASATRDYQDKLEKLARDYNKNSVEEAQKHAETRQKILKDTQKEIRRSEEDFQRESRDRLLEHNDRMLELAGNRDALGLVEEERRFSREEERAQEAHNVSMQRLRQDTRERLIEEDQRYAQEKAKRYADYREKVMEAKQQYEEQKKQAQLQYAEQMRTIAAQRAQQLVELRASYERERRERINAAYQEIRDLNGALQAERLMRIRYYDVIVSEAKIFMEKYRAALKSNLESTVSSTSATSKRGTAAVYIPARQAGGYVAAGTYRLHDDEWVASASTVRSMERAIRGRLTQQNVVEAIGGGRTNVTYNDHRRIDASLSERQREQLKQDVINAILGV